MRIQNEVTGMRPNKFADLFNQDHLVKDLFAGETCLELQQKINDLSAAFRYPAGRLPLPGGKRQYASPVRRVVEAIVNQ